jgi:mono/diheme cytochrome c family protein
MKGGWLLNLMLMALLAALIGLHWLVLPDPSRRNFEFLPGMVESIPLDAQSEAPLLGDGTVVDLRPPAGSIARGYTPLGYAGTPEDALRAGQELQSPVAAGDADAIARGAFVFSTFCSVCHGAGGQGDGTVTKKGVPPPPSLLLDHARNLSDGQMFHVISLGQGNMASYASQVERADRWRAISYIRTLQETPEIATLTGPAAGSATGQAPAPLDTPVLQEAGEDR